MNKEIYVDKTGTDQKPDPMRDVFLEFPLAMMEIAKVTAFGAKKHARRGWQTFEPEYGKNYHRSKVGRHLLKEEIEGPVNHEDGDLLHPAQTVWNMLAYLEHLLRQQARVATREPNDYNAAEVAAYNTKAAEPASGAMTVEEYNSWHGELVGSVRG